MKPVMRYHGAKFRLAPWIIQFFPPHTTYVEPFGGAAGVLLQKERCYAEVYNDLDGDTVNLFRVLQDDKLALALTSKLLVTPFSRDEFDLAYSDCEDPVERARRTLIRSSMGFGSAGATKGGTGFRIDTRRSYGTAAHLWAKYPDTVAMFTSRLQGVLIENRPAIEVMLQHDGADTLHFVDPPYVASTRTGGNRYYRHEMTDIDHEKLLATLCNLDGFVVLSGYETDMYNDILKDWKIHRTSARISAHPGTTNRTECAWINPKCNEIAPQQKLFG